MNGPFLRVVALLFAFVTACSCSPSQKLSDAGPAQPPAKEEIPETLETSENLPDAGRARPPAEDQIPQTLETSQNLPDAARPRREPDVIYVPTPHDVVDMMLHLARVKKEDMVYDLGCGDGRIVVAAAKKYGCRAVGYDIDPERVRESLSNVRKNNAALLVTIEEADIFTLDLSPASVVTLYLLAELNVRLIPQLEKLKPGSRIVSHDFDMEGVRPDAILTMLSKEDDTEHEIYLWTTPLKKEPVDEDEVDDVNDTPLDWDEEPAEEGPAEEPAEDAEPDEVDLLLRPRARWESSSAG